MTTIEGQAWTTARTLDALGRHFGYTDDHLGALTGLGRATVQGRRTGRKALDTTELETFGRAFGVPPDVLLMSAADAIRWVLDHVPGMGGDIDQHIDFLLTSGEVTGLQGGHRFLLQVVDRLFDQSRARRIA